MRDGKRGEEGMQRKGGREGRERREGEKGGREGRSMTTAYPVQDGWNGVEELVFLEVFKTGHHD